MTAHATGIAAETLACEALLSRGWQIHGRRLRTPAGEIDAVAEKDGLLAFIEVKSRRTLAEAACALAPRQQQRLLAAAEILLAQNTGWGQAGVRFDIILVDAHRALRRVKDVLRVQ